MAIISKYALLGFLVALSLLTLTKLTAQPLQQKPGYTRQDTLRGSITAERAWWDVKKYKLYVHPDFTEKFIRGEVTIVYKTVTGKSVTSLMQIDLQEPMEITAVFNETKDGGRKLVKKPLEFRRDGNVYYIRNAPHGNKTDSITIQFAGNPRVAINPPWDGGWIFTKDAKGRPWMTVACQGLGASVWYPCKDHQSDEPDEGALIQIKTTNDLIAVANGKLVGKKKVANGTIWAWAVKNPINNYNIVPYIGKYVRWNDSYIGETNKTLPLDYWVLDYNLEKSKKQFGRDVKPMLKSFEYWFGPYPFYDDGFKLVETPHLGMEHQSGIAYGNHYMDGYLGMDLSGTGWGKKWDYIIIHESGHEWFANNITTNDIADMWVHEGFTMYSEVLFIESLYGKQAANEYCQGLRKSIENDKPLIGPYGVNQEGSGDMYNKGANLIHTIRQLIDDDATFRNILRGLNADFGKETIDSRDVEEYISKHAKKDFSKIFDQYLRTIRIPELEWSISADQLAYRWNNVVEGFNMPVKLVNGDWLKPSTAWQITSLSPALKAGFKLDTNFYISSKEVKPRKSDF
jgi:aminopeptidase N